MIETSFLPSMLCLRDVRVTRALRTISQIANIVRISLCPHDNAGYVGLAYPPRNIDISRGGIRRRKRKSEAGYNGKKCTVCPTLVQYPGLHLEGDLSVESTWEEKDTLRSCWIGEWWCRGVGSSPVQFSDCTIIIFFPSTNTLLEALQSRLIGGKRVVISQQYKFRISKDRESHFHP